MNDLIQCDLSLIDPNPYQVRGEENPQAVEQLAASIERVGLLQPPTGRRVGSRVQLAFGHSRLAAFRRLGRKEMPLRLEELTDLSMFEAAVAENIERADLTPIELARAMKRYIEDFQKTSEEAGVFFHVSAETVRGTVRLLALPEEVQEQVASGRLSIGDARKVLTAQQAAPKVGVKLAKALAASKEPEKVDVDDLLASEVRRIGVEMWRGNRAGEARGGEDLFPLAWTGVPSLRADQIEFASGPMGAAAAHHLQHIPPCTKCEYYTVLDGSDYCLLKTCWEHKKEAWLTIEEQRISKQLGVAVYDPQADPKQFLTWENAYDSNVNTYFVKKLAEESPDLRLVRLNHSVYAGSPQTKSIWFALADMSRLKAPVARTGKTKAHDEKMQNRRLSRAFLRREAAPVFGQLFERVGSMDALIVMVSRFDYEMRRSFKSKEYEKLTKANKRRYVCGLMAQVALEAVVPSEWNESSPYNKGPLAMARFLQKVAKKWGVKLPSDWRRQAKAFRLFKEK